MLLSGLRADAQDPLKLLPQNYKLVFENSDVAVIRAHYGPHEALPVHDHTSFSTIFLYLNDSGPVRIDHAEPGEAPHAVTRPPTTLGSYRVAPGIVERHSIQSLSDTPSDFLRIELKRLTLAMKDPFRGKAPASTNVDSDAVEFSAPGLRIERIVWTDPTPWRAAPNAVPSLLVELPSGTVRWLPPSTPVTIPSPAYLLRIFLPNP